MSTRSQMIHRMRVERSEDSQASDSFGQAITHNVVVHGDYDEEDKPIFRTRNRDDDLKPFLPGRVWDQEARLVVTEGKIVKVAQQKAIVPYGADVKTNDIITEIYDRRGNRLFENAKYRVDSTHNFPKQGIVLALESAN